MSVIVHGSVSMPRLPAGTFGNDLAELYVVRIRIGYFLPASTRGYGVMALHGNL
jgi:hypothetical protein